MSTGVSPSAVLFVDDVARMTTFYRDAIGMTILHEEPSHVVLACAGMELVLHALPNAPSAAPSGEVVVREDSYLKLCFPVNDLAQAREKMLILGGALLAPSQEWEYRGFRACDGHDPEGNVLQLRVPAGAP
ncbi:MAG: VOC family protein [Gemmatimonadaceae bacterium]